MKVLVLDNYDSFTYNLVHILHELGVEPSVIRNDKIELPDINQFNKILLSPGPGIPDEAGIMKSLIKEFAPLKSILGVCLGHQAIAEVFGAHIYNLKNVLHGVTSVITVSDSSERLFKDMPTKFVACHYHSWAVKPESINGDLAVTATNEMELVMAIAHKKYDVRGVQFHPESIMTAHGKKIIENWIRE
jgi:anthranilate synthase component 2